MSSGCCYIVRVTFALTYQCNIENLNKGISKSQWCHLSAMLGYRKHKLCVRRAVDAIWYNGTLTVLSCAESNGSCSHAISFSGFRLFVECIVNN